jgi:hypothetical protein
MLQRDERQNIGILRDKIDVLAASLVGGRKPKSEM